MTTVPGAPEDVGQLLCHPLCTCCNNQSQSHRVLVPGRRDWIEALDLLASVVDDVARLSDWAEDAARLLSKYRGEGQAAR